MKNATLQMALIVNGGEIILCIFDDESAVLTVRCGEREEKVEVGLTCAQAQALADMLGRVPESDYDE